MAVNTPVFFIVKAAEEAASTAAPGTSVEGTITMVVGAAIALFGLYKLGTVEAVLKTIAALFLTLLVIYAVGFATPEFQKNAVWQLVSWIFEDGFQLLIKRVEEGAVS